MRLIKCQDCGKRVSDKIQICPKCGAPVEFGEKNKFNTRIRKKAFLILFLCIILLVLSLIIYHFIKKPSYDKIKESVVKIEVYDNNYNLLATGSGFGVYENDIIATNYHVIEGGKYLKIVINSDEKWDVLEVIGYDKDYDLALLKIESSVEPLEISLNKKLKSGDKIAAIGSPMGELNSLSTGIISSVSKDKGIQITASISHGSSGGVLLDSQMKVIGITYASITDGQNLNYAIKVDLLDLLYRRINSKYVNNHYSVLYPEKGKTGLTKLYTIDNISSYLMISSQWERPYIYEIDNKEDYYENSCGKVSINTKDILNMTSSVERKELNHIFLSKMSNKEVINSILKMNDYEIVYAGKQNNAFIKVETIDNDKHSVSYITLKNGYLININYFGINLPICNDSFERLVAEYTY